MRAVTILLLVAICCLGADGQKIKPKKRSNAEEKIQFQTKGKDTCTLIASHHSEVKVRIECKNQGKSYWCEYLGKPSVCRAFNNNPKLYWNQISLELKKVTNACEPSILKPSMCQKATADAEMKQVAASSSTSQQEDSAKQVKPAQKAPAPPKQVKDAQAAPGKAKKPAKSKPTTAPPAKPTESPVDAKAKKIAEEYCWESLHSFCSYFIGMFA